MNDGTNTYLYGNGRIAQTSSTTEYFLGDALGSVRQLADSAGVVTLTQSYSPYGETISSMGSGASAYQFTGESRDANGLTYLRARYYNSGDGRFLTRDTWNGDYNRPLSLNRWNYVEGNPVNHVDPSGHYLCKNSENCELPTRNQRRSGSLGVFRKSFQMLPVFDQKNYGETLNEGYTGFYGSGDSVTPNAGDAIGLLNDFLLGCRPAHLKGYTPYSQRVILNYSVHYQDIPQIDATRTIALDKLRIRNSSDIFVNYSVRVISDRVSQPQIQTSFSAAPNETKQAPFPIGMLEAYNRFSVLVRANNRCLSSECLLPDPLPQLYTGFSNFDFHYE